LGGIRRPAAAAHRQTDRMTSLAEDLLDLGRLDGNAPLAPEPVELGELAGTLAAEIAGPAHAVDVSVELDAPEPVWAACDPRATARVLRALLENALRHGAPPGSVVTIAVDAAGERARLRVSDAGAGVPEAERERIFGPLRARGPGGRRLRPRPGDRPRPGPADGGRRERARGGERRLLRGDAAGLRGARGHRAGRPSSADGHRAGLDGQPGLKTAQREHAAPPSAAATTAPMPHHVPATSQPIAWSSDHSPAPAKAKPMTTAALVRTYSKPPL
jgi:hypothetical protein